jgi:hypothetical protein
MSAKLSEVPGLEAPLGGLERALIEEFVRRRGYDPLRLDDLPEDERTNLLKDASVYASGKLMEVESRSRFLDEMHANVPGTHKSGLD